jgi:uncharacterized Zn-finger protein
MSPEPFATATPDMTMRTRRAAAINADKKRKQQDVDDEVWTRSRTVGAVLTSPNRKRPRTSTSSPLALSKLGDTYLKASPNSRSCPGCGYTFIRKSDVARHRGRCPSEPKSKWTYAKCTVGDCGDLLSRPDALKRHMQTKHPEKRVR